MRKVYVVGFGVVAAVGLVAAVKTSVSADGPSCSTGSLRGTYSFNAVGFAPLPPPDVLDPPVKVGESFPLLAIGEVKFDGNGHNVGFTEENIGGLLEANTPFEGTYTLAPGPHGVGCVGTWILQDHHTTPPFDTEPPHIFKITLARESKAFHFVTFGGGPGPASLSGEAELDKD
jgi:hypothetical protein